MIPLQRRGLLLVLSSPSGAGKTTISQQLLALEPNLTLSISVTTRPQRMGEQEGRHYYFIDEKTFDHMVATSALLEHAFVFGHHYGTPKKPVEEALTQGQDILFDIDWQGTQILAQEIPSDLVTVFILPPSYSALEERLLKRAQDLEEVVAYRMSKAREEMSHWAEYDYVIINHTLKDCVQQVRSILHAERLKRSRQTGLVDFVKGLQEEKSHL